MQRQRFRELFADLDGRREALPRVLRDQRDAPAAKRLKRRRGQREEVMAAEMHRSAEHLQPAFQIPHCRERDRALAGTALANNAQRFAAMKGEIDVPQHWQHCAGPAAEAKAEIANIDQGLARHLRPGPSARDRCRAPLQGHRPAG